MNMVQVFPPSYAYYKTGMGALNKKEGGIIHGEGGGGVLRVQ